MSTRGRQQVRRGRRDQWKYWVAVLCLRELKPQAYSPGSTYRQEASGFGLQNLAVGHGHGGTHLIAVHLKLALGGPSGSGCDFMWSQLALLGAGQLFQTYPRSLSQLRSGRWGQSLVKHPRAFQYQRSPLTAHNTQVRGSPS